MRKVEQLSDDDLTNAISALEELAQDEYGMSLEQLFVDDVPVVGEEFQNQAVRDSHDAFWRVERLIGLTIKEPFAKEPQKRPDGWESQTGARRVWDLNDAVLGSEHPDWWQYNLIIGLLGEEERSGYFNWLPAKPPPGVIPPPENVQRFLLDSHGERGVFRAILKGARRYLCSNQELEAAVEGAREGGGATARIKADPVQMIAQGGFQQVAVVIIASVPWLNPTMVPVIAGLLLLIAAGGTKFLCERTPSEPGTGVVET